MTGHKVNSPALIKLNDIEAARSGSDMPARRSISGQSDHTSSVAANNDGDGVLAEARERDQGRSQESQRFFYRWGRLLSSTLIRLRSRFDGDFDQYLIYMVFVLSDMSRRASNSSSSQTDSSNIRRDVGLNTLSIADITEIPRETARRKLRLLVQAGYLKRGANQLYYLGERYDNDEFLDDLIPLFSDFSSS